jgi:phosphoglucosamine mutase
VTVMGVVPTPAVSFALRTGGFHLGIVISASHNPARDNGLKFLGHDGGKLSPSQESEIVSLFETQSRAQPEDIGQIHTNADPLNGYFDWLYDLLPERLEGYRIAVDCANGAAYDILPNVLQQLGADVVSIGVSPDGDNINAECGATHPETIQNLTRAENCLIGIALDGDADRCVFSDERGVLINGDRAMGIWACFWKHEKKLAPSLIVATHMTNSGFENAIKQEGLQLVRTQVGDRHVAKMIQETGAKIGGEQSGHIIFSDYAPTGDGLLTAIQMLRVLRLSGCAPSELPPIYENWPQELINMTVHDKNKLSSAKEVVEAIKAANVHLNGRGRLFVRASGTENILRIMIEAQDRSLRQAIADSVVTVIEKEMDGKIKSRVELTDGLGG